MATISNIANTLSAGTPGASSTKNGIGDATAAQDRFLKLLVAQLNNQDPLNPLDNAQMTSQMAQINTVSGIAQLNDAVKDLSTQFTALQVLQGASMVGRDVLVQDTTLSVIDGQAKGAIDLTGAADKVTVQVLSPGGQVLDTLNLGALGAGRHDFAWDASAYQGSGNPRFRVDAKQAGATVASTGLARATVTSVGTANGAMNVQLQGRPALPYSGIAAIL